ncbi:MAG: hypothetical protein AAGF81_18615 [Pseudomonadota bacterium]
MSTAYRSLCLGAVFVCLLSVALAFVAAWPGCNGAAQGGCGLAKQAANTLITVFQEQSNRLWALLTAETVIGVVLAFGFLTALCLSTVKGRIGEKLTCLIVVLYTPWLITLNLKLVPWALQCTVSPAGQDGARGCDVLGFALASFYGVTGLMWSVNVVVPALAAVGVGYLVLSSWVFVVHKVID